MCRLFTAIIFLCLASSLSAQVIIENSISNLGVIIEAEGHVKTSFYLTGGKDSSEIIDIQTSCGCATIVSKDKLILPGQRIKLDATYNPEGRLGHFSKAIQVTVLTNQKKQFLNLILKGRVLKSKGTSAKRVKIAKVHVQPILLGFENEYDTTCFQSAAFTNFFNTLTYVIDKDNFVTIKMDVSFLKNAQQDRLAYWTKKLRSRINQELEVRGYKPYQVNYEKMGVVEAETYHELGNVRLSVPKYLDSNLTENLVEFNYKELIPETIVTCQDESKAALKLFAEELDALFLNQLLVRDSVDGVELIGKFTSSKSKKYWLKLNKKLHKSYPNKLTFKSSLTQDSIFSLSLKEVVEVPKMDGVNVNYEYDLGDKQYHFTTVDAGVVELPYDAIDFKLMLDDCKNAKTPMSFQIQIEIPYVKKQPNQTDWLKKKAMLEQVFIDRLKEEGVLFSKVESTILIYEKLKNEELNPHIIIVPTMKMLNQKTFLKPYQVQFNSNQFQLDSNSYVLKSFVSNLIDEINKEGYVKLIIESSSSNAPTRTEKKPLEMSFIRRDEAENFLRRQLKKVGVDPKRLLITSKNAYIEGPKYANDYFENKDKYRKFQYLKLIPEKVISK